MFEEVFYNFDFDGIMSVEDFFYGLFKNGKFFILLVFILYR